MDVSTALLLDSYLMFPISDINMCNIVIRS